MRRKYLALALVLVLLAGLAAVAFGQAKPKTDPTGKRPIAILGQKTVNLGEVLEEQDYEHSFIVKNGGTAELQILSVRPG